MGVRMNKKGGFAKRVGIRRLICGPVFGSMIALIPSLSVAAEAMNCEFQHLDRNGKGFPGEAEIQISDDDLTWFEPSVLARPETRAGYDGLRYKILERSELGIVAVMSSAYKDTDIGPVLVAKVLTIRESDGALRVGAAGADGVRSLLEGSCGRR